MGVHSFILTLYPPGSLVDTGAAADSSIQIRHYSSFTTRLGVDINDLELPDAIEQTRWAVPEDH